MTPQPRVGVGQERGGRDGGRAQCQAPRLGCQGKCACQAGWLPPRPAARLPLTMFGVKEKVWLSSEATRRILEQIWPEPPCGTLARPPFHRLQPLFPPPPPAPTVPPPPPPTQPCSLLPQPSSSSSPTQTPSTVLTPGRPSPCPAEPPHSSQTNLFSCWLLVPQPLPWVSRGGLQNLREHDAGLCFPRLTLARAALSVGHEVPRLWGAPVLPSGHSASLFTVVRWPAVLLGRGSDRGPGALLVMITL